MRLLLRVLSGWLLVGLLAGCGAKTNGPLSLNFVGSSRFTTGNRTVGAADTLATNLYAFTDTATDKSNHLTRFTATVRYTPQRAPFAYPSPLNLFINNVPADSLVTFMDSTLTHGDFLYTPVFGARTTSGTERWTFTATDRNGNSSARSFVLAVRRSDSAAVYHNYVLNLRVPATTKAARRFIDLKSGLALPAYTVLGSAPSVELQQLTDLIVLPDGLRLASPDTLGAIAPLSTTRWLTTNRRRTRFRLTTLLPAGFASVQDTVAIHNLFTGTGRAYLPALATGQVYAFRATSTSTIKGKGSVYGLLLVESVPNGSTTTGLRLQVRLAKQPR
ncbi:hypothetical protein [Hymenobacter cheonanensis]|uniref:hypothetical protein n=1 Tax=Hymenobacter sp. CA2-7 TaxID=3063993 RepID=UPI002713EAA4|nr:hypothetical protein [Hymenobacter sp. CA2-7]MDO7884554.1 hypothetical protein [Hymenobacter sp. CA2-7]